MGFPCNQFGAQEPGTDAEILDFVQSRYGVEFPMFSKIEVNGPGACDLYRFLKDAQPGTGANPDIRWNFTKFLVDRQGNPVRRFESRVTPAEIGEILPEYM